MTDQLPPWVTDPDHITPHDLIDQADPGADNYVAAEEERWHIRSDSEAEWAMAHVAAATDELTALADQYALWRQQLDRWLADATRRAQSTVAFFGDHLERYTVAVREDSGDKIKTIRLASGEISTTKAEQKVIIINDEAVIAWAEENKFTDVIKVTKAPKLTPLREIAVIEEIADEDGPVEYRVVHHETGTPIPGVAVEPKTITAKVKPRPALQSGRAGVRYALPAPDA